MIIRQQKNKIFSMTLIACLSACWASIVQAADVSSQLSAGIGVSDNIFLDPANEVDETMIDAGIVITFTEKTRKLDANIRSNFRYRTYQDETFDNELIGGLDGKVEIVLSEERLSWLIEDNFGQQYENPLAASRPDNREDVNYFTTGPTLTFPFGSRNSIGFDLRYSAVDYETRPFDNSRVSAAASLSRRTSPDSDLSFNVKSEQIEYDNDGLSDDFDRHEGFIRYQTVGGRNTFGLDVGYTAVDLEGDSGDGLLFRADWTRQVSPFASFFAFGGTRSSDQGDVFRVEQRIANDLQQTLDVSGNGIPFRYNFFNAEYEINRPRTVFEIGVACNQEDYKGGLELDRDTLSLGISLTRDFTRKVFSEFGYRFIQRDLKYLDRVDDDSWVNVALGYRFSPSLKVIVRLQYKDRDSDDAAATYNETRLFLRAAYIPAWGR